MITKTDNTGGPPDKSCLKCGSEMIVKENVFFWRGKYFSGRVCEKCNTIFENPKDLFLKHVRQESFIVKTENTK